VRSECEGVDIEVEPQLVNRGKRKPRRRAVGYANSEREERVANLFGYSWNLRKLSGQITVARNGPSRRTCMLRFAIDHRGWMRKKQDG
jgi:hypothetical protein